MQFFARLEANCFAGGDGHLGPCAWIPADSRFAGADVEDAETAQLNTVAGGECFFQAFEDCVDRRFCFIARQACFVDDLVDDVLFNHGLYPGGVD
jgi:hypothetical protein